MKNPKHLALTLASFAMPILLLFTFVDSMAANTGSNLDPSGEIYYVNSGRDEGLVAYWRFDELSGSGTSDVSKTRANGTLFGNASFVDDLPDRINFPNVRALSLDGNGDYVDTTDFDLTDDFTISLWAYPQSSADMNMIGKHSSTGGNLLNFGMYRNSYHVNIRGEFFDSIDPLSAGWQHLAITGEKTGANSTLIRLYRNGVEKQAVTLNAVIGDVSSNRAWTIGQDWDGASRTDFFDGSLDDIRIYNRTLSASEISQLGGLGDDIDGKSWADAYGTLERALGMATNGDEIWVAAGVYTPTRLAFTDPIEPRSATFQLGIGVAHYGGFSGNETSRSQRQLIENLTILSGDIDGNDVSNSEGVITDTNSIIGNNAFHVVSSLSVGDGITTLDGFTITAGQADNNGGAASNGWGGGIYHLAGSPILSNLVIMGNKGYLGGGMYAISGMPRLSKVLFEANSAYNGGGMYNQLCDPQLSEVIFQSNQAGSLGGGMNNVQANANLDLVTFNGNYAVDDGGGMNNFASTPVLNRTVLSQNHAGYGGGIANDSSDLQIRNSSIVCNVASGYGGGIQAHASDLVIFHTVFSGNEAYLGGGFYNGDGSPIIQQSAFISNSATTSGGGLASDFSDALSVSRVTFSRNTAGVYGGGIFKGDGDLSLFNAYFDRNSAGISGGGGYFRYGATEAANVVFLANSSNNEGGGFVNSSSLMEMSNLTIGYNSTGGVGGGVFISGVGSDGSLLANSILWGNQAGTIGPELFITGGFVMTETYNLISGTVGVSTDSPFEREPSPGPDQSWGTADDNLGDLRPGENSQAADAGSNDLILTDSLDLDSDGDFSERLPFDLNLHPRIYDETVDIGAYEWNRFFIHIPFIQN